MKLPRRSPFLGSRQAELLAVYRQLYPDSAYTRDLPSTSDRWTPKDRREALSVVQLWLNRSACPFAVETTAALAQSLLLDQHMQQVAASASATEAMFAMEQMGGGVELGVRVNYSMALIRFVNSIVDSYQTGGFAQSIAVIAQRIGLPLWFVELRHAATHEELPSLDVCREATRHALQWLDDNFWIPQLFLGPAPVGGTAASMQHRADVLPAEQGEVDIGDEEEVRRQAEERDKAVSDVCTALKSYRDLSKRVLRDKSLANASRDELRKYARQVATFVHRRRTAHAAFTDQILDLGSNSRSNKHDVDLTSSVQSEDADECTRSALDQLVAELVKPGGLIPQTKTKRVAADAATDDIVLPTATGAIWDPLLAFLCETFGQAFATALVDELVRIVSHVIDDTQIDAEAAQDAWKRKSYANRSFRNTADAWIRHLVAGPVGPSSILLSSRNTPAPNSARTLISASQVAQRCFVRQTPTLVPLLSFLCTQDAQLDTRIGSLLHLLQIDQSVDWDTSTSQQQVATTGTQFEDAQLDEMHERLRKLQQFKPPTSSTRKVAAAANIEPPQTPAEAAAYPAGWRLAPSTWTPTPLGCINNTIPDLFLDI